MAKAKTGTVLNPRGIPQGTPVLSQVRSSHTETEDGHTVQTVVTELMFEGDKVDAIQITNFDHYVSGGFIEVTDG